jgi:deazaflavin-dependent oxidoreductase (nitroreductase family)
LSTAFGKYVFNPVVKTAVRLRLAPGWAILETRGRKSGKLRRTPVGNGLAGDVFWIVAEHGRRAGYVRNIAADPRVRVFVGGKWRSGRAELMPHDDARSRQRQLRKLNAVMVRVMGTDLLTVRIDLATTDRDGGLERTPQPAKELEAKTDGARRDISGSATSER